MGKDTKETALRRRLVTLGLNLTPGDLRVAAGVPPVKVSTLLGGEGRLRPEQFAGVSRLAGRRLRRLFVG